MSLDVSPQYPANKRAGISTEVAVTTDHVPELQLVPDDVVEYYDAVATSLVTPRSDLPFVGLCLLERETPVEIKSVVATYADGSRGRFYVRPEQHDQLFEAAGVYLFAVCDGTDRDVIALKIVPATTVDAVIESWIDGGDGRSDYAQLAWSRVFDACEVER
jgi:hypothetical protein